MTTLHVEKSNHVQNSLSSPRVLLKVRAGRRMSLVTSYVSTVLLVSHGTSEPDPAH